MSRYLLMMGFDADSPDEAQRQADDAQTPALTLLGVYAETALEALRDEQR